MQFYCCDFNLRKLSNNSFNVYTGFSSILCLDSMSAPLERQQFLFAQKVCVQADVNVGAKPEPYMFYCLVHAVSFSVLQRPHL